MSIGLFGGTFDPIHLGHLILAERVRESAGLDAVWSLPSFQPPHKAGAVITPFDSRAEMVSLAIAGNPAFRLETIERDLPPPSYTLHTLEALQAKLPQESFHLIIGADVLPDLPKWFEPQQILKRAGLLAVPRPGTELWTARQLADALEMPIQDVRLHVIDCPLITISSREIRSRLAERKSIRYLVPPAVEAHLHARQLP